MKFHASFEKFIVRRKKIEKFYFRGFEVKRSQKVNKIRNQILSNFNKATLIAI